MRGQTVSPESQHRERLNAFTLKLDDMSIRKIVTIGEPVLRQRAADVDLQEMRTDEFTVLIDDMIETMRNANGVGLAAPQIGIGKRVFVAETNDGPVALINPRIVRRSKKTVKFEEGCLSIPGKYDVVLRSRDVDIEALTADGEAVKFTAQGFFARVMQHEIDHLDGILYVDRIEEQRNK